MPKSSRRAFSLSPAYVEMLHDVVVSQLWPGDEAIAPGEFRDTQLLGSAAGRPFQTAFGQDLYQSLFEKGAALFHSLIANHPFYNGNKRTAVLALDHFFYANGYFLALDDDQMYRLAKEVATYRERGVGHDAIFWHLVATLKAAAVSLRRLKKDARLATLYGRAMDARRAIRRHKLNRPEPG